MPAPTRQSEIGVFNPGSIESESGFVPVMPANGNTPNLAFSIYDDDDSGEYLDEYEYYDESSDRMDYKIDTADTGDRGNVVIPIPAPVLPYVPRSMSRSLDMVSAPEENTVTDPWDDAIMKNTGHHVVQPQQSPVVKPQHPVLSEKTQYPDTESRTLGGHKNSADFHSFQTVSGADDGLKIRKVHDIHLSSQQLESDGPLLLSVGSSLSYGSSGQEPGTSIAVGSVGQPEYLHPGMSSSSGTSPAYGVQHPSFIQQSVDTRLGADHVLELSKDVVYGKVSETPTTPIKTIENIDQRLLEKLSLLEQSGDTEKMKSYVTDLWSTMKNRGG